MHDPYLAGIDLLAALGTGQDESRNRAAEIAPDFVRLAVGVTYGEILSRPGLDLRVRLLVSIATLIASDGPGTALREMVSAALSLGWSRQELVETIIQTAAHGGLTKALEALTTCHDLLAETTSCSQSRSSPNCDTGQM